MINAVADKIFDELDRLGVSVNQDYRFGLMTEPQNLLVEGQPAVVVVKIYDSHDGGMYNGSDLLAYLKTLNSGDVYLSINPSKNIWQAISGFEL